MKQATSLDNEPEREMDSFEELRLQYKEESET